MSSSTSSSERLRAADPLPASMPAPPVPEPPHPAPRTETPRRIFLRIFLVVVLGMSAALGLVRLYAASMGASGSAFLGRVLEARAALGRVLAEEERLVMFFGSSMTEAGFSGSTGRIRLWSGSNTAPATDSAPRRAWRCARSGR